MAVKEYEQGDWAVMSKFLNGLSKIYFVEYLGGSSYCKYSDIDAVDLNAAIRICDCLSVDAC